MTVYVLTDYDEGGVRVFSTKEKAFEGLEEIRQESEEFFTKPVLGVNHFPDAKAKLTSYYNEQDEYDFPLDYEIEITAYEDSVLLETHHIGIDKVEVE